MEQREKEMMGIKSGEFPSAGTERQKQQQVYVADNGAAVEMSSPTRTKPAAAGGRGVSESIRFMCYQATFAPRREACGRKFADGSLRTEFCGRNFADGSLRTESCGRKFADGSLRTDL
jgi:hypothetical protein